MLNWLVERRPGEVELVDHSFVAHDVNVASFVGGEGGDPLRRSGDLANGFERAVLLCQAPDALRSIIPANVNAVEGGLRVSTIHIAAGNGVAVLPSVGEDRRNVERAFLAVAVREWLAAFADVPAMAFASSNYD